MNIVMTLLVRDEEDIIGANLDFHFAQGVDRVIATDNRSVDTTRAILERYERRGILTIVDEPSDDYEQGRWVTRMAGLAHDMGADWVVHSDADEFWMPADGDLRTYLGEVPETVDAILVDRDDFAPIAGDAGAFHERMVFRQAVSVNSNGQPLPPKVAHRSYPDVRVAPGNHRAVSDSIRTVVPVDDLRILHFPLRSYAQFERKIINGGAALSRNTRLSEGVGATWRRLYEVWRAGELPAYYSSLVKTSVQADEGVASGELLLDTRLTDILGGRSGSPGQ